jgi:hypothetical protein
MATATKNGKAKTESWSDQDGRKAKSAEHLATVEAVATAMPADAKPIVLPRLDILTIKVRIVGDSSLIVHRWSEKAKKEMLDKQMGIASAGKEKKDPERDYRESAYLLKPAPKDKPFEDGTFGFPTIAFKGAAVEACTSVSCRVPPVGVPVGDPLQRPGPVGGADREFDEHRRVRRRRRRVAVGERRLAWVVQRGRLIVRHRLGRHGWAGRGLSRYGVARQGRQGGAWPGLAGHRWARLGRRGSAWQG